MNYWKVIVATAVIFGAGVFTGGLLVNYVHLSHTKYNTTRRTPAGSNTVASATNQPVRLPEVQNKTFLPKLDDLLHLSLEQHKAIEKILADAQTQTHKVMLDTRTAIREQLTPDQRARFEELMKRPGKRAGATNTLENVSSTGQPAGSTVSAPTNPPVN